jgi:hypothetical protein
MNIILALSKTMVLHSIRLLSQFLNIFLTFKLIFNYEKNPVRYFGSIMWRNF